MVGPVYVLAMARHFGHEIGGLRSWNGKLPFLIPLMYKILLFFFFLFFRMISRKIYDALA
jgi:hypothetical protein